MVEFKRETIRAVISSPLTVGAVWFVCNFALDWTKRPLKANLAVSFIDAVIATLIYAAIEKVFSHWMKTAGDSHIQAGRVRPKQSSMKK